LPCLVGVVDSHCLLLYACEQKTFHQLSALIS
jgi:hypothetical protein